MSTEPDFRIRPAAPPDLPAVLDLLRAAALPTDGVAAALDRFTVAEDAGRLVAAAGLERHGTTGLLRSVVVDPAQRGRGAGAAVVAHLLREADRERLAGVYLLTTTADGWFPRFGFQPIAREGVPPEIRASDEFARVCPSSAVVMART